MSYAILTLADKITATEYEVTLTPADTTIDPSSVKFTGEIGELKEIKFLNQVLVMADNTYKKGFAYAKGFDQFGGEVNLSGLTVTAGVGTCTGYDTDTGKITLEDKTNGTTGAFMLIKEVPVFLQYQQGNNVLTAQETLTVSTQAYVSEVEFGEISKDGTMRDDKKITITELRSGKYYVPFKTIKDQYGNDLDAETLNTQKDGDAASNKTLFVIPGNTGAFYTTGKFGTVNKQTVIWLSAPAAAKPGTMALTITGASGKAFTKEVTIEDDPYIDQLTVTYPDLYANDKKTAALEFTAVDQYGDPMDLWEVRPEAVNNDTTAGNETLEFGDWNNMTSQATKIVASNALFNDVEYDYSKKTFTVTLNVTGAAKQMAVLTTTTAGMKVSPISLTIGSRGTAAKVKGSLVSGTDTQLVDKNFGKNSSLNFNKVVEFEDANGNTMVRGKDGDYPQFVGAFTAGTTKVLAYDTTLTSYNKFYWTLSKVKVEPAAATGGAASATEIANWALINDGEIDVDDFVTSADFYVTLYAATSTANTYYIVDDQDFHVTEVTGNDSNFTASLDKSLFSSDKSSDSVTVKVMAKTDQGESYEVDGGRVTITSGLFQTSDNKIFGYSNPAPNPIPGSETVTVYVQSKPAGSVEVNYTNEKPVAAKAWAKFKTTTATNGVPTTLVGKDFDGDFTGARLSISTAAATVGIDAKGIMTITKANDLMDTVTLGVDDNYENTMTSTKFYLDGTEMSDSNKTLAVGEHTIEARNGNQSKMIYVDVTGAAGTKIVATIEQAAGGATAANGDALQDALDAAKANGTPDVITFTGISAAKTAEIAAEDTLVVAQGATLSDAQQLTYKGSVENNGTMIFADGATPGTVYTIVETNKTFVNNGTINGGGTNNTLKVDGKLTNNKTITGTGSITGAGTLINNSGAEINLGTTGTINMTAANTFENYGDAKAKEISGFLLVGNGSNTAALTLNTKKIIVTEGSQAIHEVGSVNGTAANQITLKTEQGVEATMNMTGSNKTDAVASVAVTDGAVKVDDAAKTSEVAMTCGKVDATDSSEQGNKAIAEAWSAASGLPASGNMTDTRNDYRKGVVYTAITGLDASKTYYKTTEYYKDSDLQFVECTEISGVTDKFLFHSWSANMVAEDWTMLDLGITSVKITLTNAKPTLSTAYSNESAKHTDVMTDPASLFTSVSFGDGTVIDNCTATVNK